MLAGQTTAGERPRRARGRDRDREGGGGGRERERERRGGNRKSCVFWRIGHTGECLNDEVES